MEAVNRQRGRSVSRSAVLRREYRDVFNGFAARLTPAEQTLVRRLPEVRAIHRDRPVQAFLSESVPITGAPIFWTQHGYRGAGTSIAIVDSGIDYTHPDLGGCLGAGCKVVGGFDFVNNDSNPIDDHGHGTHVAGVAAADGESVGMAPDAQLLAYKVLNSDGSGYESDIVAAIERAVDPDNDGDYSDHADVVNLSLGTFIREVSVPFNTAVDAAMAAGALIVVAAGNDGPYFSTVGTLAMSPRALTVGATDDNDLLTDFSSRGPSIQDLDWAIKPEVAAPGDAVCAPRAAGTELAPPCLAGDHVQARGTSMAAPHVAGAAALLRGLHPSLSADETKSLVVNNAVDLGLTAMEAGAGRIDVVAAAVAAAAVVPSTLAFGHNGSGTSVLDKTRTFTLRNLDSAARTFALSADALGAGATVVLTPDEVTLAPGASQSVQARLIIDLNVFNPPPANPFTNEGMLRISSGAQTQRLPFSFVTLVPIILTFDRPPIFVAVESDSFSTFAIEPFLGPTTQVSFLLPRGVYNVVTTFHDPGSQVDPQFVVRAGLEMPTDTAVPVHIASTEAIHVVQFGMTAPHGFDPGWNVRAIRFAKRPSQTSFGINDGNSEGPVRKPAAFAISDLSAEWDLQLTTVSVAADQLFANFQGTQGGITGDLDWRAGPADFSRYDWRYHPRPGTQYGRSSLVLWNVSRSDPDRAFGIGSVGFPFPTGRLYTTPAPWDDWINRIELQARQPSGFGSGIVASHPMVPATTPGVLRVYGNATLAADLFFLESGPIDLGLGPFYWAVGTANSTDQILFVDPPPSVWNRPAAFFAQGATLPDGDPATQTVGTVEWRLFRDGTLIDTGPLNQDLSTGPASSVRYASDQPSGRYTVEVDSIPYGVGTVSGVTGVELEFDTTMPASGPYDPDPPYMYTFGLLQNGERGNRFPLGSSVSLAAEIVDTGFGEDGSTGVASVALTYSVDAGGTVTVPVPNVGGNRYEVDFPCSVTLMNLILEITDGAGNRLRQEFSPAIACEPDCGCDDEDACNGREFCDETGGSCQATEELDCAPNACIAGYCDANEGCVAEPVFCGQDLDRCNGVEICDPNLGCMLSSPPLDCDDGDSCTIDHCEPVYGCAHEPACSLDAFVMYKAKVTRGTPRFVKLGTRKAPVSTTDEIVSQGISLVKPTALVLPAEVREAGVLDPDTYMVEYKARDVAGPDVPKGVVVRAQNQCGEVDLELTKLASLLVPSGMELRSPGSGAEPTIPTPDPNTHELDHYRCYKAKLTGPDFTEGIQLPISDLFQDRRYDLKRPELVCVPTDQLGSPLDRFGKPLPYFQEFLRRSDSRIFTALLCYKSNVAIRRITQVAGEGQPFDTGCGPLTGNPVGAPLNQPKHERQVDVVHAGNEYGPLRLDTVKETRVCLPTQILASP